MCRTFSDLTPSSDWHVEDPNLNGRVIGQSANRDHGWAELSLVGIVGIDEDGGGEGIEDGGGREKRRDVASRCCEASVNAGGTRRKAIAIPQSELQISKKAVQVCSQYAAQLFSIKSTTSSIGCRLHQGGA